MSIISTWTFQESDRLPAPEDISGINTALLQTTAFFFSRSNRKADIGDLVNRRIAGSIDLPGAPETGITSPNDVNVALGDTDQVAVIDVIRRRLAGVIDGVGDEPWAVFTASGLSYCH